ncbi:MAG: hypothetical protein CL920_02335 [Deltaproteobacteria bacterium]|nr:hypothetical protein [Deltaproteobacteria bacterium]
MKHQQPIHRRVSPAERMFTRSPFSVVAMFARVHGDISSDLFSSAVGNLQERHAQLRVRLEDDHEHVPWMTSTDVGELFVEVRARDTERDWVALYDEQCRIPFVFEKEPAVRFFLLRGEGVSDILIFCHHILCDGLSLAYLMRDLLTCLGEPSAQLASLPQAAPVSRETIPDDVSINFLVRWILNRTNKKWHKQPFYLDQEDYEVLHEAYWSQTAHKMLTIHLTEAETTALVERCRGEGVTVNSALGAAALYAQESVGGMLPVQPQLAVAASLRERMKEAPGESMGFFAGVVEVDRPVDVHRPFWEQVSVLHERLQSSYTNKNLFLDFLLWCHLDPAILESRICKTHGDLVAPDAPQFERLHSFAEAQDLVWKLLKRRGMERRENVVMGTALTNLGRLDIPQEYGPLRLERMWMNPGGAFPLAMVHMVVGAVTCAGKLSILLEYAEERCTTERMEQIKEEMRGFLLG